MTEVKAENFVLDDEKAKKETEAEEQDAAAQGSGHEVKNGEAEAAAADAVAGDGGKAEEKDTARSEDPSSKAEDTNAQKEPVGKHDESGFENTKPGDRGDVTAKEPTEDGKDETTKPEQSKDVTITTEEPAADGNEKKQAEDGNKTTLKKKAKKVASPRKTKAARLKLARLSGKAAALKEGATEDDDSDEDDDLPLAEVMKAARLKRGKGKRKSSVSPAKKKKNPPDTPDGRKANKGSTERESFSVSYKAQMIQNYETWESEQREKGNTPSVTDYLTEKGLPNKYKKFLSPVNGWREPKVRERILRRATKAVVGSPGGPNASSKDGEPPAPKSDGRKANKGAPKRESYSVAFKARAIRDFEAWQAKQRKMGNAKPTVEQYVIQHNLGQRYKKFLSPQSGWRQPHVYERIMRDVNNSAYRDMARMPDRSKNKSYYAEMEVGLVKRLEECRRQKLTISTNMIRELAKEELAKVAKSEEEIKSFKASNGWVHNFLKRQSAKAHMESEAAKKTKKRKIKHDDETKEDAGDGDDDANNASLDEGHNSAGYMEEDTEDNVFHDEEVPAHLLDVNRAIV
jgi:hypothetical protein